MQPCITQGCTSPPSRRGLSDAPHNASRRHTTTGHLPMTHLILKSTLDSSQYAVVKEPSRNFGFRILDLGLNCHPKAKSRHRKPELPYARCTPCTWSAASSPMGHRLVDRRGVEPLTLGLQSRCSTTELPALRPVDEPRRVSLVRRGGLEPPTSRLSGVCSNQLSYRRPDPPRSEDPGSEWVRKGPA